ncbi:unnamed protein product, partial [Mesorhabditis spiculigera]
MAPHRRRPRQQVPRRIRADVRGPPRPRPQAQADAPQLIQETQANVEPYKQDFITTVQAT